jgi:hypothetical protein
MTSASSLDHCRGRGERDFKPLEICGLKKAGKLIEKAAEALSPRSEVTAPSARNRLWRHRVG